jgi:hypothetical protein
MAGNRMAAWGRRLVPLLTPMLVCAIAVFQYQTVQNQRETLRMQEELTEIRLAKATCYSFGYAREDVTEVAFDGATRTCRLTDGDGRIRSLRWTEGHWREEILFSLAETPLCCASARGRTARGVAVVTGHASPSLTPPAGERAPTIPTRPDTAQNPQGQ